MKPYESYKDSGVPWIGEIPVEWSVTRLKNLFSIKKVIAGELGHDVLSVTQTGLKIKDLSKNDGQLSMDYSKYQLVEPTDFVMNHMDLLTGWVDCSLYHGVTSPDYRVFTVKNTKSCDRQFFKYIFQLCYTQKIFYGLGQGVSSFGRWRLPSEEFLTFVLPLPEIEEQRKLSAYLDHKTSLIDSIISDKEEILTELTELRQAIISEAVTKGLDPTAAMKDSGVEWIWEIPVGWEVVPLHRIFTIKAGGDLKTDFYSDTETEVHCFPIFTNNTSLNAVYGYTSEAFFEADTITVTGRGAVGYAVYRDEPYDAIIRLLVLTKKIPLDCKYFTFFINSVLTFNEGSSAINQLSTQQIAPYLVVFPPLKVQEQIAQYLDEKTSKLDQITADTKEQITADTKEQIALLKEYRQSLISEVVTGKIEV